jgi:3-hydroxypropanoate dehydrogenase
MSPCRDREPVGAIDHVPASLRTCYRTVMRPALQSGAENSFTALRTMSALDPAALDRLFREARSTQVFLPRAVTDETLRELYHLVKWTPTGFNSQPARFRFVRSSAAKELLAPALSSSNRGKVLEAPVTAIVAHDVRFFDRLPELFPAYDARSMFEGDPTLAEATARHNATLQAAFLILAARALGLDAGPMAGFKADEVEQRFFPDGNHRVTLLVNLGYGDADRVRARGVRLAFEQTAEIL